MKIFFTILSSIALVACSGGDSSSTTTAATTTIPNVQTTKEKIQALEASGKLPALDRSESISGPDVDANGVRDDIDAYIAKQSYTASQTKSVQQLAKSVGNILRADTTSQDVLRATDLDLQKSIKCMHLRFSDSQQASIVGKNIEKMTANTKQRVEAYIKYQVAMNGKVLASPQGDTCE